jgi:hypothetical protein
MMVITAKMMLIIVARPCGARNGGEKITIVIPSPIGKPRSKWQKAKLYQTTQARLVLGPILVHLTVPMGAVKLSEFHGSIDGEHIGN